MNFTIIDILIYNIVKIKKIHLYIFILFFKIIKDIDAIYLTNHENCQFGPASNFSKKIPSPYPIYPRSMKLLSIYLISPTFS